MSILECNRAERRQILTQCHSHTHKDVVPASLSTVCPVFTWGIYMGEYSPQKSYIPPPKNLCIRQKSAISAAKSFQILGAKRRSLQTPWTGALPLDPAGRTAPRLPAVTSIHWCLRCPDSGHPQFLAVWCQNIVFKCLKASASWGLLPPDPLPELCPWTTLGHFRSSYPPAPLAVLSGSESLCLRLRLCFSNDVFMLGWHWQNFGPDLPLLYKMHQICSVYSQENY